MSRRFPTSFMRWQGKSVQFEKLAFVPAKITFISGQCDTTCESILVEDRELVHCCLPIVGHPASTGGDVAI